MALLQLNELEAYFLHSPGHPPSTAPVFESHPHGFAAHFAHLQLHSQFQALVDPHTLRPQAYEALLRPKLRNMDNGWHGSATLSPSDAFAAVKRPQEAIYLDRLCRVLHAMNFSRQQPGQALLFLNVSAQHLQAVAQHHGRTFAHLLQDCGLPSQQVVLEILEAEVPQLAHLQRAVEGWRENGLRIALDDFGAQHSNFDRLWQLTPDVVKLDRELVRQSVSNPRAATILPKLVEMVHDLGALVVCEGVETQEQHALCLDAGADLVQGYWYAQPGPQLLAATSLRA